MKIFLTGASGFLGWNFCNIYKDDHSIIGAYCKHEISIPGVETIKANLIQPKTIRKLLSRLKPDAIIHTAANSDANDCQHNPTSSYNINVKAAVNLAEIAAEHDIPFVFTSTDLVFDGRNAPYREESRPNPLNLYGQQKAEAEKAVLASYPHATIARMPLMFGEAGPVAKSFLQPMVNAMREGREVRLFTDEFRTPVSGTSAANGLVTALNSGPGIYHLGGRESISRYDFGLLIQKVFEIPGAKLIPKLQYEVSMPAPRPVNVSLDSSKAFGLGYNPLPLEEELRSLKKKMI